MSLCACGSGQEFEKCCGPLLAGQPASTAEALMRSRYTAYTRGDLDYVERTDAEEARGEFNRTDSEIALTQTTWQGLEILRVENGGPQDETGIVEFVVRYSQKGQPCVQHEISTFSRVNGIWFYKDSEVNPKAPPAHSDKVGRNDKCTCGSGKKFKKCCGA